MKKITISMHGMQAWLTTTKGISKKVLWFIARHAFLLLLLFILIDMAIGECLFYAYIYLPQHKVPDMSSLPTRFKENTYQSVLDAWQKRQSQFDQASAAKYTDPFH